MIAVERLAIIWCEGVKISLKNFSLSRIRISSPFAVNITESRKLVPKLVLKPGRALKHPHRTNSRSTSFPRVALTRVGVKSDTANRETAPHHRRASLSDYFFLRRTKKKKPRTTSVVPAVAGTHHDVAHLFVGVFRSKTR